LEKNGEQDVSVPKLHVQLLNNQAVIDVNKGLPEAAYERLTKALSIVPKEAEDDLLLLYQSMRYVCEITNRTEEAARYTQLAQELATKLGL